MKIIKLTLALSLFLLIVNSARAYDYDSLLLRAQSTIFPKIILLDKNIKNKTISNNITIAIIHRKADKITANNIKSLIMQNPNIGDYKIKVVTVNDEDMGDKITKNLSAFMVLNAPKSTFKKITKYAIENKRIVFSYNHEDLSKNALISIIMKEKTYVYLNKSALHYYNIKFSPLFYKIVKVIE